MATTNSEMPQPALRIHPDRKELAERLSDTAAWLQERFGPSEEVEIRIGAHHWRIGAQK